MLAFSGKGKFVITKVNLSRYIHELEPIVSGALSRGVEVQYRLDDDLPDLEGDASQVRQLLMNLVRNASDAMDERGGIVRISTGIRHVSRAPASGAVMAGEVREGFHVYVEVRDTGAGMDEATMARVFDPFFTTKFMGRGLGMAAALGIVRGHNGAIRVVSRPRQGTTVTVFFPPATSATPNVPPPPATVVDPGPDRLAVLVVDDEETVRSVTAKMLERSGYDVLVAGCGQDGLDVFEANRDRVMLVLLDLTMPDVMGDQVFQQLRQLNPEVRVILMSGYDEKEATVQFAGEGLAGFIQKPFSAKQLRTRVEGVLNGEMEAETNGNAKH
jgi:CheY-like chemotaxis protein